MILLKYSMDNETPPCIGRDPPLSEVPAPLVETGILLLLQCSNNLETSRALLGFKTTSGGNRKSSV